MSQLTKEQQNDIYRRKVALGEVQGEMTGYPSIDKPWLKNYSEEAIKVEVPSCSVYQNIYERNKNYSQNIAIEYFGTKITYSTMFQEIDRTAEAFINAGIRKNDIVNFFTSSTPEIIIAILALGKIGAVANMINPTFTDEQIISRVNETEARLMIVMEQLYSKIENIASKLCVKKMIIASVMDSMPIMTRMFCKRKLKANIVYSDTVITWKKFINEHKDSAVSTENAYEERYPFVMVYSSGTTGASKGIVLTHDGINATISHYISPDFPYKREDKFLQMIPIWFSTGIVVSCLMPLCLGITVILEPVFSAKSFCDDVRKYKPTMTLVATSLWLAFIKDKKIQGTDLSFLEYPITGGEQLLKRGEDNINSFLAERNCTASILQGWGMCELGGTVTACSTTHKKSGSTGFPIRGVTVAAFDVETDHEMKYNQRGELRVITPARMKYYYKNEVATSEFFKIDSEGCMWGCTGDIGYVDENGDVYVLGRSSDFFQSSTGRKIYNFDIESVLYKSENVAQCEVVGIETEYGYEIPIAHIVKEKTYTGTDEQLIKELYKLCCENLEEDSVPHGFKLCTGFPVKASGKRDMEKIRQDRDGIVTIVNGEFKRQ